MGFFFVHFGFFIAEFVCGSCRRTIIIFDIFLVDFTSNIIFRVVLFFRKFRTFTETRVPSGQVKFTIHAQFGRIDHRCVDRGRDGVYFMDVFCPPGEKTKCVYQRQQGQQGNLHSSQYTPIFDSLYTHSNALLIFFIVLSVGRSGPYFSMNLRIKTS